MGKFQRTYTMTVQGRLGSTYTFKDPLTVIFDISSRATGGVNTAHFMLYNLSPVTRHDIEFDSAIDIDEEGAAVRRALVFNAGYVSEGFQPVVFQGNISKAYSYRDGPNVITDIEVKDGLTAIQRAQIQSSRAYPWDPNTEVTRLVQSMTPYGVQLGAIGTLFKGYQPKRGVMWLGSTWDVLKKIAFAQGGYVCINQLKVYVMSPTDVLVPEGALVQLDATTGLIGTPRRSGWVVDAEMLFEPRVQLLQQLKLKSTISPSLNGTYSVQAISHRGIISGAKDGGVITAMSLTQTASSFSLVVPQ